MKSKEIKTTNRPRVLGLFETHLVKLKKELKYLEIKRTKLNDSPAKTHKILAIDLFNKGKLHQGIDFTKEEIKNIRTFSTVQKSHFELANKKIFYISNNPTNSIN